MKGKTDMTKARALTRAKARAAAKAANPAAKESRPAAKLRPGQADTGSNTMRNTSGSANINTKSAMRRGAQRSR